MNHQIPGVKMADDHPELKGLAKHLNSVTLTGRANVAKVTIGSLFLIFAYLKLKSSKKNDGKKVWGSHDGKYFNYKNNVKINFITKKENQ